MAAKQNNRMAATIPKFIASLIFLYVVFAQLGAASASMAPTGNVWISLLYAAAVLGSITLFVSSIGDFVMSSMLQVCSCKASMVTPFALLAWIAVVAPFSATNMWLTVLGAVLLGFGSCCCCMQK